MLTTLALRREAAKGAALSCILAVCTDERRYGPGRSEPPHRPTGTEDLQGRGGGGGAGEAQCATATEGSSILGIQLLVFPEQVIEVPTISTASRWSRTVLSAPQMAEQLVEVPTVLSKAFLPDVVPWSITLTLQFLAHAHVVDFKVFLRDRVPHSVLRRRTMIFQFPALVPVVVFPQDRVRSAQRSRSSTFQCLARVMAEVFLYFTLIRVQQLVVELLFPGGLIMRIFRQV